MAREEFVANLRHAHLLLQPPRVESDLGRTYDSEAASRLDRADLWLTPKAVEGFDPDDFSDLSEKDRKKLSEAVAQFLRIATNVPPDKPATARQSNQARKHLETAIKIVGRGLRDQWLEAQRQMINEAIQAAHEHHWYVEEDQKRLRESLLGEYQSPRLRIRTPDTEVVLDPVARFGSGRQGIVDLLVMPTYETRYLVLFKDGRWQIVTPRGSWHKREFNRRTLARTIDHLAHE